MKSYTTLRNLAGQLSQNVSTQNLAFFDQWINDAHRYLLQKYFNNETSFSITTVGAQSLTLTGSLAVGAIDATLSSAWLYYTTTIFVTFSSGEIRNCQVQKGSTSLTWSAPLTETATTAISVGGLQYYPMPPNYSKLKTFTINIGTLKYQPYEILTRQEWDDLNVFPYYGDIPDKYYIFPGGDHSGQVGIWPIPATSGNLITFTYKYRVPDLSVADYTTPGTLSVDKGSVNVLGTGSSFPITVNPQLESRWIKFSPPKGDNLWYQIYSVDSTTGITLYQPYQGASVTGATAGTYTIGQMPILGEDFHDMLVYKPLFTYFSSVNKDKEKAQLFDELYEERLKLLDAYAGTNTVDVNLGRRPQHLNPNLFPQDIGGTP